MPARHERVGGRPLAAVWVCAACLRAGHLGELEPGMRAAIPDRERSASREGYRVRGSRHAALGGGQGSGGNPQRGRRRQDRGVSCPNCAELTSHVLSSAGQLSVLCPTSALCPPPRAHSAASSHPIAYQGVSLCLSNASFSPLSASPCPLLDSG